MSSAGSRGGTVASLAEAQQLYREWRMDEWGWLRARILLTALKHGEYHGDYLAEVQLTNRSIIGAVVNAMVRQGLIRSTGEHRMGRTEASHGRRSYVYELTKRGNSIAVALRPDMVELAVHAAKRRPDQPNLFDPE